MKDLLSINPQSYWLASTEKTDYPTLQEDLVVDVVIIGGGMTGITAATLLKKEGLKVAIIEADGILQGTTGHTTAKITSQHGLIYDKIKNQMGEEKARQYADANQSAIHMIADLIKEKNIDCDFSWQSAFVYTQSETYVQKIANEAKTAAFLDIKATYTEDLPLPFPIKAAVAFEGQAQFHPRKYLLALAKEIPGDGSYIFENTKAVDIEEKNPAIVITEKGPRVFAFNVIIASHYPFYDKPGFYFSRLYPERSYVLGLNAKEKFPGGMFISAEEPTRSLRSQAFKDKELILLSGEHHKTGHGKSTLSHYKNLEKFANEHFEIEDILFRWSTQDYSTPDGLPYAGQLTATIPNIYVATGFHKWGMTNSTVSAMLLRDLIVKGDSPWASVYDPSRFTPAASASNFIVENVDVAVNFVSGKILPAATNQDLQPNEGKVLQVEGKKVGAYRDEKGELHLVDTTCTHMYCETKWNDAEKTWDCPCHGSRFSCDGDIVEGPALKPLTKYK
ncbi:FAD-dependent oxidoreductase [Clostridium formicaceticum]|uniref:(2Fe-2S)-binding protein n=1 Tax=Clostridium formicaceticum TaxID=1497 RepID=A0AAC9RQQ3_9CLOT|nr:FAD-dependent oxidoreductase [Clostridium formicaceticum]AOY75243.1 (2Fe-2S)-binding protein [Clostridium formicaceticum]ARE89677.1 Gamma-glutamylputrescine oxidoreductase [Clostridium formicaceticum]